MNKALFLILLTFVYLSVGNARTRLEVHNDKNDCLRGWISMDVEVRVDGLKFDFSPSCNFSFLREFKTVKGMKCRINAGMCSAFSPKNKFEVRCDDGAFESVKILCLDKK